MRKNRASNERLDDLRRIPTFSGLTRRQLAAASRFMTQLDVDEGKRLSTEGRRPRQCMVVETGEVTVRCGDQDIATLGPGDWIDTDIVRSNRVSPATTVARTSIVVSVLSTAEFDSLLHAVPAVATAMATPPISTPVEQLAAPATSVTVAPNLSFGA